MVAAYQYRAFPNSHCEYRLGLVVAAGVTAVENAERDDEQHSSLAVWADQLGVDANDIQKMAMLSDRQKERVQSLAAEDAVPTSHPLTMTNAFRDDVVTGSLDREDVLAGAPDAEEGFFKVPRILDET